VIFLPSIKVAKIEEIPPGTKKSIKASKTRVLICNVNGKYYATQSICSHLSNPLFTGKLEGTTIWCDKHWASFDVTTGKAITLPEGYSLENIPPLKTYPIRVEGSDIIVDVPE